MCINPLMIQLPTPVQSECIITIRDQFQLQTFGPVCFWAAEWLDLTDSKTGCSGTLELILSIGYKIQFSDLDVRRSVAGCDQHNHTNHPPTTVTYNTLPKSGALSVISRHSWQRICTYFCAVYTQAYSLVILTTKHKHTLRSIGDWRRIRISVHTPSRSSHLLFTVQGNRFRFDSPPTNQDPTRIPHWTPIYWPFPVYTSNIFIPPVKTLTSSSIYATTSAIIENGRRPAPRSRWRCGQLQQQW